MMTSIDNNHHLCPPSREDDHLLSSRLAVQSKTATRPRLIDASCVPSTTTVIRHAVVSHWQCCRQLLTSRRWQPSAIAAAGKDLPPSTIAAYYDWHQKLPGSPPPQQSPITTTISVPAVVSVWLCISSITVPTWAWRNPPKMLVARGAAKPLRLFWGDLFSLKMKRYNAIYYAHSTELIISITIQTARNLTEGNTLHLFFHSTVTLCIFCCFQFYFEHKISCFFHHSQHQPHCF